MTTIGSSNDAALDERLAFIGLDAGGCANIARLKTLCGSSGCRRALDAFYAKVRANAKGQKVFPLRSAYCAGKECPGRTLASNFLRNVRQPVPRQCSPHRRNARPNWPRAAMVRWRLRADCGKPDRRGGRAALAEVLRQPWPQRSGKSVRRTTRRADQGHFPRHGFLDLDLSRGRGRGARKREGGGARERARSCVSVFGEGLEKLATQDLTFRIGGQLPEAYQKLQADFNAVVDKLTSVVEGVTASSNALRTGTSGISVASDDLSRRTEQRRLERFPVT